MALNDETLASVDDLAGRLSFEMDEGEEREAENALIVLSDAARFYGSPKWTDVNRCPRQVVNLILNAAARHMKNYEGYTVSRAGDESVSFTDRGREAGSAHFTETEKQMLGEMGGFRRVGLYSVGLYAYGRSWDRRTASGLVPDGESNEPIQMFASDEDEY